MPEPPQLTPFDAEQWLSKAPYLHPISETHFSRLYLKSRLEILTLKITMHL